MNREDYERYPIRRLLGRKVRLLRPLNNGWATIAKGTLAVILGKHDGFALRTDPCPTCGVWVSISHVQPEDVELLLEGVAQPALMRDDEPLFPES